MKDKVNYIDYFNKQKYDELEIVEKLKQQLPKGYIIVPVTPSATMLKASSLNIGQAQTEYYRMIGVYPPYNKDSV